MALINPIVPIMAQVAPSRSQAVSGLLEPSVWWTLTRSDRRLTYPLPTTPLEVITAGLDLQSELDGAEISNATASYISGHGLVFDLSPVILQPLKTGVGMSLAQGRRNSRHVLDLSIAASDGQVFRIKCPVHVGR